MAGGITSCAAGGYTYKIGPGGTFPPPPFLTETCFPLSLSLSLSRDFQHLISEASLKYREVAWLIISVMIVNKLQYFVDPFPFALQTKGQSH